MIAKFQGRCGQCKQTVLVGEEITWLEGKVYCEGCTNSGMFGDADLNEIGRGAPKDRCPECYIVHAGECY